MRSASSQGRRSLAHSRSAHLAAAGQCRNAHPAHCVPSISGPVRGTAGATTQQSSAVELTVGLCAARAEPGNGLPPAPRRSFSSGSWKGRKQQDVGSNQQYESVVVRTATGGHPALLWHIVTCSLVGVCGCDMRRRC